jgi:ABC-type lipoprotein release transport system permease subunit
MGKFIKLAWRNMWRNWRRTAIAVVAIVLSLILLLFYQAFVDGLDQAIYGNLIRLYGGNVLIHSPGYRDKSSRLPMLPLENADAILEAVRAQPNVRSAARRINTGGFIAYRDASHAVNITAIEPQIEASFSLAAENITLGRFLTPEDDDHIVIGQALAEHLNVTIGDRVTLLGRRKDESMRKRTMTVVGIFDLGLGDAEKALVYMNLPTAQTMYNLRGQETEIAVILEEVGQEEALIEAIAPQFPNHEVDSLFTLRPEFKDAMDADHIIQAFISSIVLFMAAIGVLNLMLMAVFERTREMGVLGALGMKRGQVMGLFLLEGALIGAVGAVIGCVSGWLLVAASMQQGIDFSMYQDYQNVAEIWALMGSRLYPHITSVTVLLYGVAAVVVGALGTLYPAWQASRQEPAEALHFE